MIVFNTIMRWIVIIGILAIIFLKKNNNTLQK